MRSARSASFHVIRPGCHSASANDPPRPRGLRRSLGPCGKPQSVPHRNRSRSSVRSGPDRTRTRPPPGGSEVGPAPGTTHTSPPAGRWDRRPQELQPALSPRPERVHEFLSILSYLGEMVPLASIPRVRLAPHDATRSNSRRRLVSRDLVMPGARSAMGATGHAVPRGPNLLTCREHCSTSPGLSNRDVPNASNISRRTAHTCASSQNLVCRNRTEAASYATRDRSAPHD